MPDSDGDGPAEQEVIAPSEFELLVQRERDSVRASSDWEDQPMVSHVNLLSGDVGVHGVADQNDFQKILATAPLLQRRPPELDDDPRLLEDHSAQQETIPDKDPYAAARSDDLRAQESNLSAEGVALAVGGGRPDGSVFWGSWKPIADNATSAQILSLQKESAKEGRQEWENHLNSNYNCHW